MSKQHRIKWRNSDTQELTRAVKNFNAKVNRLLKKDPQLKNVLPQTVKVAELKDLINTRQDLKREINALRRFSKRGAEQVVDAPGTDYNIRITKWQRTEMNRRIGIINKKRNKRLEEIESTEMTSRGEPLGYTRGQLGMGPIELAELRPMKAFVRRMRQDDLKYRWKAIQAESQTDYFKDRDFALRENYIKGIKTHYDYERVKDIIKAIEEMDIKDFLNTFYQEGSSFEIPSPEWNKIGADIKYNEYLSWENALRSTWLPNKKKK